MVGRKGVACGKPVSGARCIRCRVFGPTPGICDKCSAPMPETCPRKVPPGAVCPDHPDEKATGNLSPARWIKTDGEKAQLERLRGMSASQKCQEIADALTARALESGDPNHLDAASKAMALWLKTREME